MAQLDLEAIRSANPLPDVVAGAGVDLKAAGGEWKACCPLHADRTPSFYVFDGGRKWTCFGCGKGGDVFDFVGELHGVGLREAAELLGAGEVVATKVAPLPAEPRSDRRDEARAIWRDAEPIKGTVAETYLRGRGIHIALPPTLRFAVLPYGRGERSPCLVAAVTGGARELLGIQRTFLAPDGSGKADVPKPKLSLGRVRNGAIRLAPITRKLVVCEGLEDGLTLQQELGVSVWCAAGASMLPAMAFPDFVQAVAIGGDGDEAGEQAAMKAARAFSQRGLDVRTFFPNPPHKDFNDELRGGGA